MLFRSLNFINEETGTKNVNALYDAYDEMETKRQAWKDNPTDTNKAAYKTARDAVEAFPPVIRAIFPSQPAADRLNVPNVEASETVNVPQGIIVLMHSGIMDAIEGDNNTEGGGGPQFDPIKFVTNIGFATIEDDQVYIVEKEVRPVIAHVKTGTQTDSNGNYDVWEEKQALACHVAVHSGASAAAVASVKLKYPKADGATGTAEFTKRQYNQDDQQSRIQARTVISPQEEQHEDPFSAPWVIEPWEYPENPTPNVITD